MPRKDTVESHYRIRLRDASGKLRDRRGKSIPYFRAKFFDITYKKQVLIYFEPFHPRSKAKGKERKAESYRGAVFYEHQRALKARAKKAAATREKNRKGRERELQEFLDQELTKLIEKERGRGGVAPTPPIDREKLLKDQARFEEAAFMSKVRRKKVLKPVLIVPVDTRTNEYSKEYLFKKVMSEEFGKMELKILDFTLKEPIEISRGYGPRAKKSMEEIFIPHLTKFFKESQNSRHGYIFRIKYMTFLRNGAVEQQGISLERKHRTTLKSFLRDVVEAAFINFQKVLFDRYLGAEQEADINGFTLEVIEKGGYP